MRTATIPAERPLSALDVIVGRRSVRSYAAQPLEASTVRALLDAAVRPRKEKSYGKEGNDIDTYPPHTPSVPAELSAGTRNESMCATSRI